MEKVSRIFESGEESLFLLGPRGTLCILSHYVAYPTASQASKISIDSQISSCYFNLRKAKFCLWVEDGRELEGANQQW